MAEVPSFNAWLARKHGITNWVVAKRTRAMVNRYGEDAKFFSPTRFRALCEEHRVACREELLMEIASRFNFHRYDVLRAAFEAGRSAQ